MHISVNGPAVFGNVGPASGHATMTASAVTREASEILRGLAQQTARHAHSIGLPPQKQEELGHCAADLERELASPAQGATRLGRILASIKSIAEIAAGDLIAPGILHELARPEVVAFLQRVVG